MATPTHRNIPPLIRERRWWLLLLALWCGVMGYSFYAHANDIRKQTTQIAIEGARNMFRMVILTRNWNASHSALYVPVTPETPPNEYLEHARREVTTTDGVVLTMINPAYMTRLIAEMAQSDSGAIFRLTSLKPIRPANAPDDWERESLLAFERGIKETTTIERDGKWDMLRYMAPLPVEVGCLKCHEQQGYKVGEIRGGISVSQRYASIEQATLTGIRDSSLTYFAVFLLVLALGWTLLELLRQRWHDLVGKIQELEDTQSQLLQSEKMASIGQLAAGVAHEINNPVGFVNSNLGTLKNYTDSFVRLLETSRTKPLTEADLDAAEFDYLKTDIADLVRESQDGLARVKKIVADLKAFSHVDEAEWQDADLNAGMESTLNVVWHELKYKAEIVREYGELPPVRCIGAQINQVFMNLLINAAHAIGDKGTITLRSGCDQEWVWMEVGDSGPGIAPEIIGRIFDPFFTTKPVGKGTGLGLSLSYDVIKKHGGRIDVSSPPGAGAHFRVMLPLNGIPADKP
jgi:two-component system NtrC family sensor kinase